MGQRIFFNSLCYIDHDHLSNVGERTQISGTQNIDAKIFLFSSFSLNTCKGTDAAATAEPCSRPDVA